MKNNRPISKIIYCDSFDDNQCFIHRKKCSTMCNHKTRRLLKSNSNVAIIRTRIPFRNLHKSYTLLLLDT